MKLNFIKRIEANFEKERQDNIRSAVSDLVGSNRIWNSSQRARWVRQMPLIERIDIGEACAKVLGKEKAVARMEVMKKTAERANTDARNQLFEMSRYILAGASLLVMGTPILMLEHTKVLLEKNAITIAQFETTNHNYILTACIVGAIGLIVAGVSGKKEWE